jgi:hypothetical protein
MPYVPEAFKLADQVWPQVRDKVLEMRGRLRDEACQHRGTIKLANEASEDPKGVKAADGTPSGLLFTFRVAVERGGEKAEKDFSLVYAPQIFYLVSPSREGDSQIVSHDESIDRLDEIVHQHFYAHLVRLVEETGPVADDVTVTVEPVEERGFSRPVIVEEVGLGPNNEYGARVLSTQPIEDYNAELEQALMARP